MRSIQPPHEKKGERGAHPQCKNCLFYHQFNNDVNNHNNNNKMVVRVKRSNKMHRHHFKIVSGVERKPIHSDLTVSHTHSIAFIQPIEREVVVNGNRL